MGAPVMAGMGVGALTALATGKDPFMGAAVGGASGGMFGGAEGFGSGFGFDTMGFDVGTNLIGDTAATGLTSAGTSLGQGGMQTAAGSGLLGATPSMGTLGAAGLSTSVPETAGGYSDLLGGDSMLQNYDMGMNGIESQLNTFSPENIGSVTGANVGIDYPDFSAPPSQSQSNGYVLTPDELETGANLRQYGGLETPIEDSVGLLDGFKEFVPSDEFMGQTAFTMGMDALTPEQRQQVATQQARLERGQMPNFELEQGYGSQFISRA